MTVCTLENKHLKVDLTSFGATILKLIVKNTKVGDVDIVLGLNSEEDLEKSTDYIGSTVGRCANRIKNGVFSLNGKTQKLSQNDGQNHLHGGKRGFSFKEFEVENFSENSVKYHYFSPDGEEGYSGNLNFSVEFALYENALTITYFAESDADTVMNPTNHAYFNLNGESDGSILDNLLTLNSDFFTPVDKFLIPMGKIEPTLGVFDFRTEKPIGQDLRHDDPQIKIAGGYDHNFCLKDDFVGRARSQKTGVTMEIFTDMCGVQFYSGNSLNCIRGKSLYNKYSGFCLETQAFPNSVNFPDFGKVPVLKKGEKFKSQTKYIFKN